MPRVPTYDNFQASPTVQPNAQFDAPRVVDATGTQAVQMGEAMQRAGGTAAKIELDAIDQANQVRVNDAVNKALQSRLKLTYDTAEGFVHLKGDAALTRPTGKPLDEEYAEKLQQQIASIGEGLGNDAQRRLFQQKSQDLLTQFRGNLTQHVAKEYGDYQLSVQEGTVKTNTMQMAASWGNPALVGQSMTAIRASVAEAGRLRGWSAVQTEAATVQALSPGVTAVIQGAVDGGKLDYAREYAKQHDAFLTPEARLHAKKILDAGDFEARTQDATEKLLGEAQGDTARALTLARERFTGKDEDAIVTRIKARDAEQVTLRERAQKTAADQAWQIYEQTGALSRVPPSVIASMDGRDRHTLRRTARADAEARAAAGAGATRKTDPSVYYALTVAAAQNPAGFGKEDLRSYADKLSPGDFKHFVDVQAKLLKPGEAGQVVGVTTQIDTVVKTLGLKNEKAGVFMQSAQQALFAAQTEKGRQLDQGERQKVLDGLVLQGTVPGSLWGTTTVRAYEARAQGKPFTPTGSDDDRRRATDALKRAGVTNPTKQQIDATIRATYGQ